MSNEQIWHVDENDKPIGSIGRDESRRTGARYRIVRVSVEDADGNILVQKRQPTKKSYPNCWDTAVGGNVNYGESYEDAARREALEEIGLVVDTLDKVAYFYSEATDPDGSRMNRFTKIYRVIVDPATKFTLQPEEVSEVRWVAKVELLNLAKTDGATDGLAQTIERYYTVQGGSNA